MGAKSGNKLWAWAGGGVEHLACMETAGGQQCLPCWLSPVPSPFSPEAP